MNNIRTTVKDYYNERVYSKRFGYGELTKVYGDEIYFKFDNWGFIVIALTRLRMGALLL